MICLFHDLFSLLYIRLIWSHDLRIVFNRLNRVLFYFFIEIFFNFII
jgi:hypothetical protein